MLHGSSGIEHLCWLKSKGPSKTKEPWCERIALSLLLEEVHGPVCHSHTRVKQVQRKAHSILVMRKNAEPSCAMANSTQEWSKAKKFWLYSIASWSRWRSLSLRVGAWTMWQNAEDGSESRWDRGVKSPELWGLWVWWLPTAIEKPLDKMTRVKVSAWLWQAVNQPFHQSRGLQLSRKFNLEQLMLKLKALAVLLSVL